MKKQRLLLSMQAIAMALFMNAGLTACSSSSSDDDDISNPDSAIDAVEPSKEDAMSPATQKEKLEAVALEFMDKMPSSDFREIAELGKYISETYTAEYYDWGNVESWARDAFEAARQALGTETKKTETKDYGNGYTYKYNYVYTNYRVLLLLSNFTGHFTARNDRWVMEQADDLKFIFTDKNNQECILSLEAGGNVKLLHLYNSDDRTKSQYENNIATYLYDRNQIVVSVPENIVVRLTQGGSEVIKTTVNVDLGSFANEELNISKDNFTMSALVELNNGYKINVSKVAYTANTTASASFTMSKNGTALVTMGVSANASDLPSVNVSDLLSDHFDADDYDFEHANAKNALVRLDILGKVQIQGTLSDVRKFADYIKEADDNEADEKTFKSYINQANGLADINLFYDGSNVKQATIKWEPFADETWNGKTYWKAEPVINFFDGSSYSTFQAFFNDKDFRKTIDAFKTLSQKYADLLDKRINW